MIKIAKYTSRDTGVLLRAFRERLSVFMGSYAARVGIDLLVICTDRSAADQEAAYSGGHSHAKPGESWHQWHLAADLVPLYRGKPLWAVFDANKIMLPEWTAFGEEAEKAGLTWSGRWKSMVEYGHVQYTAGIDVQDVMHNPEILAKLA